MNEDLSKLGLVELYDALIQPTPPPDISMLPATSGWIWIGIVVTLVIAYFARKWVTHRRANAYRRKALGLLGHTKNDPVAIATLLRETALAAFPRQDVAGLIGDDWLSFLDKTVGKTLFSGTQAGKTLTQAPYKTQPADPDLTSCAKVWIHSHSVIAATKSGPN